MTDKQKPLEALDAAMRGSKSLEEAVKMTVQSLNDWHSAISDLKHDEFMRVVQRKMRGRPPE